MTELVTGRLVLRPFEPGDLAAFVAYRSDPEVARFQGWDSTFSMADAERFLDEQRGVGFAQPGAWLQLAIVDRATGQVHGDCAVHGSAEQPATAEVGVTLARGSQGRGVATEALTAVLDELFGPRQMHRVIAQVDDRNDAVRRLLDRLGFRLEGRLVEADWSKGEWTTLCSYALLDREWAVRA